MLAHDLAAIDPADPRFGGKARSLARLIRAGFPVPPGFVVPPEALVREPSEIAAAVSRALAALGPGPFAVRSSAIGEDSTRASFAGQHLTVLGVRTPDEVLAAIERVRASAVSDTASAYRAAVGGAGAEAAMAVIVQVLVPARAAGVAFTADPVTNDPGYVTVAAVPGLGESLVSGQKSGDTYRVRRHRLRGEGGPPSTPSTLSPAEVRQVARVALEVERRLALAPADVEWALSGERIFVLQARPVTTAPHRPLWFFPQRLDEMLSRPVSPLMVSLFDRHFRRALPDAGRLLGLDLRLDAATPLVRRVHGRPYLNLTLLAGLNGLATAETVYLEAIEGTTDAAAHRRAILRLLLGGLRRLRPGSLARLLSTLVRPLDVGPVLARSRTAVEAARLEVASGAGDADLLSILLLDRPDLQEALLAVGSANALCRGFGELWLRLDLALTRLAAGAGGVEPLDFIGPASGLVETDVAERLFALSRRLAGDPRGIAALAGPGAAHEAFRELLAEHGDRAPDEADIATPRWREDPAPLAATLAAYLALPDEAGPSARLAERQAVHRRARAALLLRLGDGPRFAALDALAALTRRLSRDGENTKAEIVRFLGVARSAALALGSRLTARGVLGRAEDVFLLTDAELADVLVRPAPLADLVERRQREQEEAALRPPPRVVDDRLRPLPARPSVIPAGVPPAAAGVLHGIAASPGRVSGRVRIVHSPSRSLLKPGEVLVARQTDPSWTPLFVPAAAVVVEVGSLLSHASIVARELGIPSVVAVRGVLAALKDGDLVEVDGGAGTVVRRDGA